MNVTRTVLRAGWAGSLVCLAACELGPTVYLGVGPQRDAGAGHSESDAHVHDAEIAPTDANARDAGLLTDAAHGDGDPSCGAGATCATDGGRPLCNPATLLCVACLRDADCAPGLHCKLPEGECDDELSGP